MIDYRELFYFGLTSKGDDESKIGHKGTGLKFILAQLHRNNLCLMIKTPELFLISSTQKINVRGTEYDVIMFNDQCSGKTIETGIMVNLGSTTWYKLWYIHRELLQNALDEGGKYKQVETLEEYNNSGSELIIQDNNGILHAAYEELIMENYKEPDKTLSWTQDKNRVYYKGFSVYSNNNFKFSYDVSKYMDRNSLSENRELTASMLHNVVYNCIFNTLTEKLFFDLIVEQDSYEDLEIFFRYAIYYSRSVFNNKINFVDYFNRLYANSIFVPKDDDKTLYYCKVKKLKPIIVKNENAYKVLTILYPELCFNQKLPDADIVDKVPEQTKQKFNNALKLISKYICIDGITFGFKKYVSGCIAGECLIEANTIYLNISTVNQCSFLELIETLIHEIGHLYSKADDCSDEFEASLVSMFAKAITKKG